MVAVYNEATTDLSFPIGAPLLWNWDGREQHVVMNGRCTSGEPGCVEVEVEDRGSVRHVQARGLQIDWRPGDVLKRSSDSLTEHRLLRIEPSGGMLLTWPLTGNSMGSVVSMSLDTAPLWVRREPTPDVGGRCDLLTGDGAGQRGRRVGHPSGGLDGRDTAWFRRDGMTVPISVYLGRLVPAPEPEAIVEVTADDETARLRQLNATQMDRIDALMAEVATWEGKWHGMSVRLAREANERGWCPEYDAIAEEMGLPTREDLEEDVEYAVKVQVSLSVSRNGLLGEYPGLADANFDIESDSDIEVEFEFTDSTGMALGGCVCNKVDNYVFARDHLNQLGLGNVSISNAGISCDSSECRNS